MHGASIVELTIVLLVLVLISAFFSGSEIGMMSFNKYRLNHLVKKNHKNAKRIKRLLDKPDRLLGVILIGNTLANIIASAVATVIGQRMYGDTGMAVATGILTFVILIFSEMMPKTLAALYPEKIAFRVALILQVLLKLLSPVIALTNFFSNGILRLFGVQVMAQAREKLSRDELKSVLNEAGSFISSKHKSMFLSLIDIENVTVNDIMVPRGEIVGIDLADPWEDILEQLETAQHTRLVVYTASLEHIEGMVHIRSILNLMAEDKLTKDNLYGVIEKPYFILQDTDLYKQLILFQQEKKRSGLVVDEYGDIQGLVTLEDILEEIVGEFTTDMASVSKNVIEEDEGVYFIDASITIRELNRTLGWELPMTGPKTLNGVITEILGSIPPPGCCLKLNGCACEILQVKDNMIKTVRIQWLPQE